MRICHECGKLLESKEMAKITSELVTLTDWTKNRIFLNYDVEYICSWCTAPNKFKERVKMDPHTMATTEEFFALYSRKVMEK